MDPGHFGPRLFRPGHFGLGRLGQFLAHQDGPGSYCTTPGVGVVVAGSFWLIFTWPGQRPGRAIAVPPASASTFTLKFFKSLYFSDHLIDLVHIWYDDKYSSKVLFSNTPAHYLKVKSSYFPSYIWILFIFGMINTFPKFYSAISYPCL